MAEIYGKADGVCRGAGGTMHIFDKATYFHGGWALVAEQLPYAVGAARSILLDRRLDPKGMIDDDRIAVVFIGDGGAQNGRMAECLNAAAKEKLPILFVVIDNGRAINTFTHDVSASNAVFLQGQHYGVPGLRVDGEQVDQTLKAGRAVVDYVRTCGPAILQVHTYRLAGHSPTDPEIERGRKAERKWAHNFADPIKLFEESPMAKGLDLAAQKERARLMVDHALAFASNSPEPPAELAEQLEYPDTPGTDYNTRPAAADAVEVTRKTCDVAALMACKKHIASLHALARLGELTISGAVNLAVLEEMLRDPTTVCHAEDLQVGSAYSIPKMTQQTFGSLRAADEIINEGHFLGKALGEALNGYRPIVEMMHADFAIYGVPELSTAANTYSTSGGQMKVPLTVVGAGGEAPGQAFGAQHSQPFHAYVMAIPGLKIGTAATPDAAYGMMKSMIRDDSPCFLFLPVQRMEGPKGRVKLGECAPIHKCVLLESASDEAVEARKAVTVLTYLHGVKEAQDILGEIRGTGIDIDLVEMRCLKPLDLDTIRTSLARTHRVLILDESTRTGGVGATVSATIGEQLFDMLDKPVHRLAMSDAPVPFGHSLEAAVVQRGQDLLKAIKELACP